MVSTAAMAQLMHEEHGSRRALPRPSPWPSSEGGQIGQLAEAVTFAASVKDYETLLGRLGHEIGMLHRERSALEAQLSALFGRVPIDPAHPDNGSVRRAPESVLEQLAGNNLAFAELLTLFGYEVERMQAVASYLVAQTNAPDR